MKLTPHVILEGTRLTHKTDIAFALNSHPRVVGPRKYQYHSPIISAEWCALTNTPWGRGLINFESSDEESRAMETYRTWARLFELQRYYSWMIDRFHLSTMAWQQLYRGREFEFSWLEDRLVPLNFRLVVCTRSEASFAGARAARLKVSGKPSQYDDLGVFVREQAMLRELASASKLTKLEVDVSDDDVAGAADQIADWLAETGGLHQDDSAA